MSSNQIVLRHRKNVYRRQAWRQTLVGCAEVGLAGRIFKRGSMNSNARLGLNRNALHPENAAVQFQDRPMGARLARDLQPLQDLFDFARAAGVLEGDAVAGFPGSEGGEALAAIVVRLDADVEAEGRGGGLSGDWNR